MIEGIKQVIKLTIGQYIKLTDIETYKKIMRIYKTGHLERPEIKLGDKPENLMKHDSYRRAGRRIKQRSWG